MAETEILGYGGNISLLPCTIYAFLFFILLVKFRHFPPPIIFTYPYIVVLLTKPTHLYYIILYIMLQNKHLTE